MPKTENNSKPEKKEAQLAANAPAYLKQYLKRKYFYATGRRKTAISRVRLYRGKGQIYINDQELKKYFSLDYWREKVTDPLKVTGKTKDFDVVARVKGGGPIGQAEAVRLGIARALVLFKEELRQSLKDAGYLKRDPREKERKKPGLKRARRAPQWAKR